MNELEQTLQRILEKSLEVAESTGEFVINQAPDLLRQFFTWHTIAAILGILLSVALMFITIKVVKIWGEKKETNYCTFKLFGKYYDEDGGLIAAITVLVIFGTMSTIIFCVNFYQLCYILIAPKLYLIDYFVN